MAVEAAKVEDIRQRMSMVMARWEEAATRNFFGEVSHMFRFRGQVQLKTLPNNCTSAVSHPKMLDIYNIKVTVCIKIVYVANSIRVDHQFIAAMWALSWCWMCYK